MTGSSLRVALFGGIYSNHVALRAAIDDAQQRGCEKMFCLGDLGAFGPNPDKVFPLLIDAGVVTIRGNYDDSIGKGLPDCQCGYTDPADNYYARLSYQYTYSKTGERWRHWLVTLPEAVRFKVGEARGLCCHGSPRTMNEFLWESTTPTHLLEKFCDQYDADLIVATHTGLPWIRHLSRGRMLINCGVLGRPPNDGTTEVGYVILDMAGPQYIRLAYDYERLAAEMEAEKLPAPFIETIRTGWWTTCLEILPAKERALGKL